MTRTYLVAVWCIAVLTCSGTALALDEEPGRPELMKSRAKQLADLLAADKDQEAREVLGSYRRTDGLADKEGRLLLCHVGQRLLAREQGGVNDRLRSLDPATPIMIEGDVRPPGVLDHPAPAYTKEAREARLQGTVILQAVIEADGHAEAVEVLKGLPLGLAEKAVDAVQHWSFSPATLDGQPVTACYALTVSFRLNDGGRHPELPESPPRHLRGQ